MERAARRAPLGIRKRLEPERVEQAILEGAYKKVHPPHRPFIEVLVGPAVPTGWKEREA
jgi:hypothetical protein